MLRYRAATQPDDLAYIFLLNGEEETGRITYSELDREARTLAGALNRRMSPGDRGLLLYPSSLSYISGFFGCLYAGVVPVPSYPPKRNKPDHRLQSIVRDATPSALLCQEDTFRDLEKRVQETPELEGMHWFPTDRLADHDPTIWSEPDIHGDDLAFLQYTSGSTSTPKGVMVSHDNLLQNMKECDLSWGFDPGGKVVTWLPIFHDLGLIFGILQPLFNGIPCVFMPPLAFLQQPYRWLEAISKYRGTHSAAPNFAYDLCVDKVEAPRRGGLDLTSWTMAMNAAEPVRAQTMHRFADYFAPSGFSPKTFSPAFGLAEGTLKITTTCHHENSVFGSFDVADLGHHTVTPKTDQDPGADGNPTETITLASSGHTIGETGIVIADPETSAQCSENQVGEIWISGPTVAKGYWGRPDETAATFQAQLSDQTDGTTYLRTGDLGFLQNGECFVTGRHKDVIITRGINHYPQDIEYTVQQAHTALRPDSGAAFSIVDDGEEHLVVVQEVQRTSLKRLNPSEVFDAVRHAIFDIHGLSVHTLVLLRTASILKTSSGKIQRNACRDRFLKNKFPVVAAWTDADRDELGGSQHASPSFSTANVRQWITVWVSKKCDRDPASLSHRATFDSCGMDSVSAVEFAHDLSTWIGRDLDETIVWSYPTIEALSEHVSETTEDRNDQPTPTHSPAADDPSLDDMSEDELVGLLYDEIDRETPGD